MKRTAHLKRAVISFLTIGICSPAWCQTRDAHLYMVQSRTVEELVNATRDDCSEPVYCTLGLRRLAAQRLAKEFPELFADIALEIYEGQTGMASTIAELYWRMRVDQSAAAEQEALLWKLYSGEAEGPITATEHHSVKNFAADVLCETGTHDRFDELRAFLTARWTRIETVVEEVTYCQERYQAIHDFGSRWEASIAMLEGKTPATIARTRNWAMERIRDAEPEINKLTRPRLEAALAQASFRWQKDSKNLDPYSAAYWMLSRDFQWSEDQFEKAGITQQPWTH